MKNDNLLILEANLNWAKLYLLMHINPGYIEWHPSVSLMRWFIENMTTGSFVELELDDEIN